VILALGRDILLVNASVKRFVGPAAGSASCPPVTYRTGVVEGTHTDSERVAVERAIVNGLAPAVLRPVLQSLNDEHALDLTVPDIDDDDLPAACVKALKQKGGLHRLFIDLLPRKTIPELVNNVIVALGRTPHPPTRS
jgi:hypothetical protein